MLKLMENFIIILIAFQVITIRIAQVNRFSNFFFSDVKFFIADRMFVSF